MIEVPPPALDLELRLIRYFIAVAEHGQFSRAAAALHIGQPSLSRQIRGLEHQLGVRLLERTPRGTRLSEAGEAFLPKAKALLRAADEAAAGARAAAAPGRVCVGFSGWVIVTPATTALRRRR
ncbi:LysR family transcriptional regulator, partial [Amycolatopsis sp. NPDC059019]|uniref:LysR family transcriptional regulator n=1 Tax=Amycolatopsis sp. NPDC059019 TaxID=3346702 RepID=UPI00366BAE3A